MTPLEYMEEGITEGDWWKVGEGYRMLTGRKILLPIGPKNDLTQAHNALRKIISLASKITPIDKTEIPPADMKQEPKTKKKLGRPMGSGKKKVVKEKNITKKKQQKDGDDDPTLQLDDSNKTAIQKETGGTRLITNEPDIDEMGKNKVKAERAKKNKLKLDRQAAQKYRVKCNECGETFESDRKSGEMGQKCPSCLREKKSRFS